MNKSAIIKKTEVFVKAALAKEGTGHDWWHIERIRNNAKAICKAEKADAFIVDLALLLHDVGDRKVLKKDEDDHSVAGDFLKRMKVSGEVTEQVMFIIENMSFSKTLDTKRKDSSKEFQVVQDADRLDALGAIGIARAFAFGGSKGRSLYDPTKKAADIRKVKDYKKLQSSSLHHFYEKLFLLKDLLNTKAARKIAQKRHDYMKEYVKEFLLEWEGKR